MDFGRRKKPSDVRLVLLGLLGPLGLLLFDCWVVEAGGGGEEAAARLEVPFSATGGRASGGGERPGVGGLAGVDDAMVVSSSKVVVSQYSS